MTYDDAEPTLAELLQRSIDAATSAAGGERLRSVEVRYTGVGGWLVSLPGCGAAARGDTVDAACDRLERRLRRGLVALERARAAGAS